MALLPATLVIMRTSTRRAVIKERLTQSNLEALIQIAMFATPVAYPSSLVPERWRALLGLNPMAGVVEGFRWALLGKSPRTWSATPSVDRSCRDASYWRSSLLSTNRTYLR